MVRLAEMGSRFRSLEESIYRSNSGSVFDQSSNSSSPITFSVIAPITLFLTLDLFPHFVCAHLAQPGPYRPSLSLAIPFDGSCTCIPPLLPSSSSPLPYRIVDKHTTGSTRLMVTEPLIPLPGPQHDLYTHPHQPPHSLTWSSFVIVYYTIHHSLASLFSSLHFISSK